MRAKTRTGSTVPADDRLLFFIIKKDGLHNAGFFAFMAADTLVFLQKDTAAGAFGQSSAGAGLHARRILAGYADNRYKMARHTAACAYFN